MRTYHNDQYIRILFNPETLLDPYDRYGIGPQGKTQLTAYDGDHSDDDTIYVMQTGSDSDAGTWAEPMLTIAAAIVATTSEKNKVIAHSSSGTAIFCEDYADIVDDYCTGVYAHEDSDDIYVVLIDATTYAEYLAFTSSGSFIYVNSDDGDDTTGDGSYNTPYATIAKAKTEGDSAGADRYICLTNSETYEEAGLTFDGDTKGIWAYPGETPTYNISVNYSIVENAQLEIIGPTAFDGAVKYVSIARMSNDAYVLAYQDDADSDKGKFAFYDSDGAQTKAPTVFCADATSYCGVGVMSSGNFVIAYVGSGSKGYFVIRDSNGDAVKTQTEYESGTTLYSVVAVLPNDSFVVAYRDDTNSGKGTFVIYSAAGVQIKAPTLFRDGATTYIAVTALSNGNFVIAYNYDAEGYFVIYDSTGTVVKDSTSFESDTTTYTAITTMLDDNFCIAYADAGDSNKGKFVIYDSAGDNVVAITQFEAGATTSCTVAAMSDDSVLIAYKDDADSDKGKFVIYNSVGVEVLAPTEFEAGATDYCAAVMLSSDNYVIAYRDIGDSNIGKYVLYQPPTYTMLLASVDTILNGLYLTQAQTNTCGSVVRGDGATLSIRYCGIDNAVNDSGRLAWAVSTDDELAVQCCSINSCDQGIYAASNTVAVTSCKMYNNEEGYALHVDGAGVGIEIEHNTLYANYAGIRLENNDGDEIIKNNIVHANNGYAINADTDVDVSYSVITGDSANVTKVGCVNANPLFLNTGDIDEDDTDLHLMDQLIGYDQNSPAKNLADDTSPDRNAGCYDTVYIGEGETWSSLVLLKPKEIPIKKTPVGATRSVTVDGTIHTGVDGFYETVEWEWDAMTNTELAGVRAIYACKNPRLLVYPDCVTLPSDYDEYTLIYDGYKMSPKKNYKLSRTGVSGVSITVERRTE